MGKSTPALLRSSTWRYAAKTGALPPKLAPLYQSPEELVRAINEEYGRLLHNSKPIEYVYKNEYARHMLSVYWDSFSIQFEYPVGDSWADIITVTEDTGISVVEIKTERDTPARLGTQVSDYRRLTPHASLLVSGNDTEKYARACEELGIPALTFSISEGIQTPARTPEPITHAHTDPTTIISYLRDKEQQQALKLLGATPAGPETSNITRWRRNKELLLGYPAHVLWEAASSVALDSRRIPDYAYDLLMVAPAPLTACLLQVAPNRPQCDRLAGLLVK
jgi:hypothetical protein